MACFVTHTKTLLPLGDETDVRSNVLYIPKNIQGKNVSTQYDANLNEKKKMAAKTHASIEIARINVHRRRKMARLDIETRKECRKRKRKNS